MDDEKITIPLREYRQLLEAHIRMGMFRDYIKKDGYVSREQCAEYLGLDIEEQED